MNTISPIVGILKSKRNELVMIQHYALMRRVGCHVAWGLPESLTLDEFKRTGMNIVLKSLADYGSRDGDQKSGASRETNPKEQIRFAREHLSLGVRLERPNSLMLSPTHRERGGYIGHRDEEIKLVLPCNAEEFFCRIMHAFERCS